MTPKEIRIAIAQDVLSSILPNPDIEIVRGAYVGKEEGKVCQVCAVGSLFVAAAENRRLSRALGGDLGLRRLLAKENIYQGFIKDAGPKLEEAFDQEQLGLIEVAFEGHEVGHWGEKLVATRARAADREYEALSKKVRAAIRFGEKIKEEYADDDSEDRQATYPVLTAIMQNIVRNGEFQP